MKFIFLIFYLLVPTLILSSYEHIAPEWISTQIDSDLECFRINPYSLNDLETYYQSNKHSQSLCKFSISNRTLFVDEEGLPEDIISRRIRPISKAFKDMLVRYDVPDTTLYICWGDAAYTSYAHTSFASAHEKAHLSILGQPNPPFPILVQCKLKNDIGILMPDFSALDKGYQVLEDFDFETSYYPVSWHTRLDQLVWRGGSCYHGLTYDWNLNDNKRLVLCELSRKFRFLINAGFTHCVGIFPEGLLKAVKSKYSKPYMPPLRKLNYKYQIWIDGHVSAYSCSGWQLYSGSTVLKVDSDWIQWYYQEMVPYKHYVPVKEDLSDLISQLIYLKQNPDLSYNISTAGAQFAMEHITYDLSLLYLKEVVTNYAQLPNRH